MSTANMTVKESQELFNEFMDIPTGQKPVPPDYVEEIPFMGAWLLVEVWGRWSQDYPETRETPAEPSVFESTRIRINGEDLYCAGIRDAVEAWVNREKRPTDKMND